MTFVWKEEKEREKLRILFATEYLPPYVSGIANRCKNLINGYRQEGHQVTVCSVEGSECDIVVPSIANPFYNHQRYRVKTFYDRTFILPPLALVLELLNIWQPVNYDICHIVAPLCLSFIPLIPIMWLRGIKIYISYHVYLEYYRNHYLGDGSTYFSYFLNLFSYYAFPLLYYIPLSFFADCVGIPSKTADYYVFEYSQKVHLLKSGLDTTIFHPDAADLHRNRAPKTLDKVRQDFQASTDVFHLSESMNDFSGKENSTTKIKTVVGETDHEIQDIRDLAGYEGNEKNGPILIYTGRLAMEKSINFLIESMANPLLKDATLVIVGDGPIRLELEALAIDIVGQDFVYSKNIMKSNPRNKIIFTGMILDEKQVASFYAQADIFVSASGSETFGFTVAEAMSCCTPAVVVRSGAFPTVYKMIMHQMFETDDMQGYAECIERVYKDIGPLSDAARKISCNGFSIESSVRDLIHVYYWILEGCQQESQ